MYLRHSKDEGSGWVSSRDIKQDLGISEKNSSDYLCQLQKEGKVTRRKNGKYNEACITDKGTEIINNLILNLTNKKDSKELLEILNAE